MALIGDGWLKIKDKDRRRRLDNPEDFVRLEIEAALRRSIRVIPVLIDGATMPRADQLPASLATLAGRQAHNLSPNRDRFESDVAHLLKALDKYLSELQDARPLTATQAQSIASPPASPQPRMPTPDEMMASLSPGERAATEKIKDPQQRDLQLLDLYLRKQMRQDMLKAVAQNFKA